MSRIPAVSINELEKIPSAKQWVHTPRAMNETLLAFGACTV